MLRYTNEKSRYLTKSGVSCEQIILQPVSNHFTAVFRHLYDKMALIILTFYSHYEN